MRMKNPHFTPAEEKQIAEAERIQTRATIYELGVGEFLKTHMPCASETSEASQVLQESVRLRESAAAIHGKVGRRGRAGRPMRPIKA